jgi:hypothetical protein
VSGSFLVLRLTFLGLAAFTPTILLAQETVPDRFDFGVDLHGRHPEIFNSEAFRSWIGRTELGPWHETAIDSKGRRNVVLQNNAGDKLFAAIVSSRSGVLIKSAAIDLVPQKQTRSDVLKMALSQMPTARLHAIRPVVNFLSAGGTSVYWEIETIDASGLRSFHLRNGRFHSVSSKRIPSAPRSKNGPGKLTADDMSDNEIHHLATFGVEARAWVSGAATVEQKARRIFDRVNDLYLYDGNIQNIWDFTWADYLTRNQNQRRGICDELAVVEISYLRSVGIPARLKFLVFLKGGRRLGHAVLEYLDGATWKTIDAAWKVYDDPAIYRHKGYNSVTVMDADYPDDSRSTIPAWGVFDPTGDGKLHPYEDFVIVPKFAGNPRPGYSF